MENYNSPLRRLFYLRRLNFNKKNIFIILISVFILFGVVFLIKNASPKTGFSSADLNNDGRYQLPSAKKQKDINQEFVYPLLDDKGEKLDEFKYIIEKAEIRNEIIVQGKKATAVRGRTFLILNLKLVNNFNKAIEINSRDYVRLVVNNNEADPLAPDIHNDPVEVQAISTKYTRVGFPIDDNAKSLKLRVGEIKGEKKIIDLNFS